MSRGDRGIDFVTVDGGEGGTGASPPIFADSIALPFRMGFSRVYGTFAEAGLTDDVTFIGSAKLGLPDNAVVAFALGADMVNVAREAMMSIGCIQSQKCHTDRCPTGVATQDPWLVARPRPGLEGRAVRAVHQDLPQGAGQGLRVGRRRPPRPDHRRGRRHLPRRLRGPVAARGLRLQGRLGRPRPRARRGDHLDSWLPGDWRRSRVDRGGRGREVGRPRPRDDPRLTGVVRTGGRGPADRRGRRSGPYAGARPATTRSPHPGCAARPRPTRSCPARTTSTRTTWKTWCCSTATPSNA